MISVFHLNQAVNDNRKVQMSLQSDILEVLGAHHNNQLSTCLLVYDSSVDKVAPSPWEGRVPGEQLRHDGQCRVLVPQCAARHWPQAGCRPPASSRPQGGARSGLRVSTLTEPILMFLALYGLLAKFYYLY